MYRKQRFNGKQILSAHPDIARYITSLYGQTGGAIPSHCVKGVGKTGSFVFTVSCIKDAAPGAARFREVLYSKEELEGDAAWVFKRHSSDTLMKMNSDKSDTADEMTANAKVHQWATRMHFLHYTALHPTSSHVIGINSAGKDISTMIILRQMGGDVSKKVFSDKDIVGIAKAVLVVLHIIHLNGHLHLDVKPANILFTKRSHEVDFALADFGIVDDMRNIYRDLLKNTYSGTPGYISPLLLPYHDDTQNRVYETFRKVALEATRKEYTHSDLAELFQVEKLKFKEDPSRMSKIDLHSLGLTLYHIIQYNKATMSHTSRKELISFVHALLFFDMNHFLNTFHALKYLCQVSRVCTDIDVVPSSKSRQN